MNLKNKKGLCCIGLCTLIADHEYRFNSFVSLVLLYK
jgi:hypothetical protein